MGIVSLFLQKKYVGDVAFVNYYRIIEASYVCEVLVRLSDIACSIHPCWSRDQINFC